MGTGDQSGTWGNTTNFNLGTLVEQAISSYCTQQFNNADITLTLVDGSDAGSNTTPGAIYTAGTASVPVSARNMYIECQGTSSGNNLYLPLNRKLYFVYNNITSGGGTITVRPVSGAGTTVAIAVGQRAVLACDGTNIVHAVNSNGGASGTANYVAKFSNTYGLGNSVIYDNGTNVGIGTSSPSYRLTATGVSTAGSVTALALENPSTNAASEVRQEFRAGGTSWAYVTAGYNTNSPFMAFGVSAASSAPTERMRIDSSGNVGIGTTSPTSKLTLAGNSSTFCLTTPNILETATVVASPATGTINFDLTTQSVVYYTSNATGNWTLNFRASSGTTLASSLAVGQAVTAVFIATQGTTPYYNTVLQIDGTTTGVTIKWQGGTPGAGNASGIDSYSYTIIKTGSATYTVLATQSQFY
jgi:hypothetical protein